MLFFRV